MGSGMEGAWLGWLVGGLVGRQVRGLDEDWWMAGWLGWGTGLVGRLAWMGHGLVGLVGLGRWGLAAGW